MRERRNKPVTIDDLVRFDERKDILRENRNRLNQLAKTTYPQTRSSGPSSTPQQLDRLKQITLTPAESAKTSQSNHLARITNGTGVSTVNVDEQASSTISDQEPTASGITYGTTQNMGGLLK